MLLLATKGKEGIPLCNSAMQELFKSFNTGNAMMIVHTIQVLLKTVQV